LIITEWQKGAKRRGVLDKPWLAVDGSNGLRRGTVYVGWSRVAFPSMDDELLCASMPPGAARFSSGAQIGTENPKAATRIDHQVQLAVRHDGTLDAVWRALTPESVLLHACSTDGGKSFSKPTAIGSESLGASGELPSLAAGLNGMLLLAWTNAKGIYVSRYKTGAWSKPIQVFANDVTASHANPALAVAEDALWLLTYRKESKTGQVSVLLHRSSDGGTSWAEHYVIAARTIDPTRLQGFEPGHYVGLAATKERVYAAYVFPSEGRDGKPWKLQVSRVE